MVDLLHGETVQVWSPVRAVDAEGDAVIAWTGPVEVAGALVAPGSTSALGGSTRPDGVEVAYTVHFPKSFDASLRGARVQVRGELFEVVGDPRPYARDLCPGAWWMQAEVRRVQG